jgi:4-hydroxy-3-methylbut-2-enyl diphosphate reductase
MKIIRSRYAGACYGVERALLLVDVAAGAADVDEASGTTEPASNTTEPTSNTTEPASGTTKPASQAPARPPKDISVHTLGPLIHNPQVVSELRERGVAEAHSLAEVDEGILVIRSHGVAPAVIDEARQKGLQVVDATCPHVSKAHRAAHQLREKGYLVMVVGELGHPEVEGIRAYAGDGAIVVQDPSDLPDKLTSDKIGIVVQTTQAPSVLDEIVAALRKRGISPLVRNTICFATRQRQEAATELAKTADVMLVVGGRNSGNTTRLAQLCQAACPRTYHIESEAELEPVWFEGAEIVGITAGASTPENQIIAVEQILTRLESRR